MSRPRLRLRVGKALTETRIHGLRVGDGDYHEGLEEGVSIGRREALMEAVRAASLPAGNRLMDFGARQEVIVKRIRRIGA